MGPESAKFALAVGKVVQGQADKDWKPPVEAQPSQHGGMLPDSIFRGTRGYIEKIVFQINRSYEQACYDGCSVLMRRLLETLIVEAFERNGVADQIKNNYGQFLQLGELIEKTCSCTSWNLSRNSKRSIRNYKNLGDVSAHNRYYLAHRHDIDKHAGGFRIVAQELLHIAGLK